MRAYALQEIHLHEKIFKYIYYERKLCFLHNIFAGNILLLIV